MPFSCCTPRALAGCLGTAFAFCSCERLGLAACSGAAFACCRRERLALAACSGGAFTSCGCEASAATACFGAAITSCGCGRLVVASLLDPADFALAPLALAACRPGRPTFGRWPLRRWPRL